MISLKDWEMHSCTPSHFFLRNDNLMKIVDVSYDDNGKPIFTVKNLSPIKDDERRRFITNDEKFERIKKQNRYELDLVEVILYCEGELDLRDDFSE